MTRRVALVPAAVSAVLVSVAVWARSGTAATPAQSRSLVVNEAAIAVSQPGPHNGGGTTTAFPFFASSPDFTMAFRKRILHKGSSIGYHRQEFDEVYYIVGGEGEYTLNGVTQVVRAGTAMLTRVGDSHGLRPRGDGDVALIIAYQLPSRCRHDAWCSRLSRS